MLRGILSDVVVSHFLSLLGILLLQLELVVHLVHVVRQILNCPLSLFVVIEFVVSDVVLNLTFSLRLDLLNLVWSQAFKVVRNVSVGSELGFCGLSGLSHDIAHIGS
jgi:hypothetical protein